MIADLISRIVEQKCDEAVRRVLRELEPIT